MPKDLDRGSVKVSGQQLQHGSCGSAHIEGNAIATLLLSFLDPFEVFCGTFGLELVTSLCMRMGGGATSPGRAAVVLPVDSVDWTKCVKH